MHAEYDIPDSVSDLFSRGEASYRIIDPEQCGDNVFAMNLFLEAVGVPSSMIELHDGTQVVLFDGKTRLQIDCGGLGDFDRHGYDVTVLESHPTQALIRTEYAFSTTPMKSPLRSTTMPDCPRHEPYWIFRYSTGGFIAADWSPPFPAKSARQAVKRLRAYLKRVCDPRIRPRIFGAYRKLHVMPGKDSPETMAPRFHNLPPFQMLMKRDLIQRPNPEPKPDAYDINGRPLTFGMRVACWNSGEKPSDASRNLTLLGYMPTSALPYITNAGAFAHMLPDHQPDMLDWIAEHVTD